jgi:hypothetical protein
MGLSFVQKSIAAAQPAWKVDAFVCCLVLSMLKLILLLHLDMDALSSHLLDPLQVG